MSTETVLRAVQSAAREAFNLGVHAAKQRTTSSERERAVTFAAELVMPSAEHAIEEAREQGFMAAKRVPEGAEQSGAK